MTLSIPPPTLSTSLPIVETFHSVQGEGVWAGSCAFFIRTGGCNVGCPWCDTKHSWPQNHHPQQSIATLVESAIAHPAQFVVITGGEPLMHDLTPLTTALKGAGLTVHLETSGAYPLSGQFDWITLSPKPYRPPHPESYQRANELKVVVSNSSDFDWAEEQAAQIPESAVKLLQPQWESAESSQLVFDYILAHPEWRLSLQTHKLLGVR